MEEFRGAGIAPGLLVRPLLPLQGFLDADLVSASAAWDSWNNSPAVSSCWLSFLNASIASTALRKNLPLLGEVEVCSGRLGKSQRAAGACAAVVEWERPPRTQLKETPGESWP